MHSAAQAWRVLSTLLCAFVVFNLFYLGSKPVAVGLFQPPMDKVAHFATFSLITTLLWVGALRGRPWMLGMIASLIAAADEMHQLILPGRSAGFDDLAADLMAVAFTILLLDWLGCVMTRKKD